MRQPQHSGEVLEDGTAIVDGYHLGLDRLRFDSVIGTGANGVVFAATQLILKRSVAVKVWPRRMGRTIAQTTNQALGEIQKLARLNIDHIVQVFDAGVLPNGWVYSVMELVEGYVLKDIHDQLVAGGDSIFVTRHLIWSHVKWALLDAERLGLYHGDLHAGNVIAHSLGATVIDFGSSALAGKPKSLRRHASMVHRFARWLFPELRSYVETPDIPHLVKPEYATQAVAAWVDAGLGLHQLESELRSGDEEHATGLLSHLARVHSTTLIDLNTPVIKWLESHGVARAPIDVYRAAAEAELQRRGEARRKAEYADSY